MVALNLLECPHDMLRPNLPTRISPIFDWDNERWPFYKSRSMWRTYNLGIRLASFLLEQPFVLDYFSKALFAPVQDGYFPNEDGWLVKKRYLADITHNADTRARTKKALENLIAPMFCFKIPQLCPIENRDYILNPELKEQVSGSFAFTTSNGSFQPNNIPTDPTGHFNWSNYGGYGVSIYLNEEFYNYGVKHEFKAHVRGTQVPQKYIARGLHTEALHLRINLLFALVLLHELCHVIDELRHYIEMPQLAAADCWGNKIPFFGRPAGPVYYRANNKREEWGYDFELWLTGGVVLTSVIATARHPKDPEFVLPIYGLYATSDGLWQEKPGSFVLAYPINMYWVANWFRKEMIKAMGHTDKADDIFPPHCRWTHCHVYIAESSEPNDVGGWTLWKKNAPGVPRNSHLVKIMTTTFVPLPDFDLDVLVIDPSPEATDAWHPSEQVIQKLHGSPELVPGALLTGAANNSLAPLAPASTTFNPFMNGFTGTQVYNNPLITSFNPYTNTFQGPRVYNNQSSNINSAPNASSAAASPVNQLTTYQPFMVSTIGVVNNPAPGHFIAGSAPLDQNNDSLSNIDPYILSISNNAPSNTHHTNVPTYNSAAFSNTPFANISNSSTGSSNQWSNNQPTSFSQPPGLPPDPNSQRIPSGFLYVLPVPTQPPQPQQQLAPAPTVFTGPMFPPPPLQANHGGNPTPHAGPSTSSQFVSNPQPPYHFGPYSYPAWDPDHPYGADDADDDDQN
jgi:hypothetical protein